MNAVFEQNFGDEPHRTTAADLIEQVPVRRGRKSPVETANLVKNNTWDHQPAAAAKDSFFYQQKLVGNVPFQAVKSFEQVTAVCVHFDDAYMNKAESFIR